MQRSEARVRGNIAVQMRRARNSGKQRCEAMKLYNPMQCSMVQSTVSGAVPHACVTRCMRARVCSWSAVAAFATVCSTLTAVGCGRDRGEQCVRGNSSRCSSTCVQPQRVSEQLRDARGRPAQQLQGGRCSCSMACYLLLPLLHVTHSTAHSCLHLHLSRSHTLLPTLSHTARRHGCTANARTLVCTHQYSVTQEHTHTQTRSISLALPHHFHHGARKHCQQRTVTVRRRHW